MQTSEVIDLGRMTLETALWVGAPLLVIATLVSLLLSVAQVLTSLQDATLATVPRLLAVGVAAVVLFPWMIARLGRLALHLFSDFHPYLR